MRAARTTLLGVVLRWGKLGVLGVGGPQAHTALLRELMVERERLLTPGAFQDAVAATSLLPGPASTQLAIYCARVAGGTLGGILGGLAFILPGFALIVALSALYLGHPRNAEIRGAGAGAAAVVVVVIAEAGVGFARGIASARGAALARRVGYAAAAGVVTLVAGPWVLAALLGSGLVELAIRRRDPLLGLAAVTSPAKLPALAWVAFKIGALSFGGGLVIIPLMQHDVVGAHHWLSQREFADAVALGQLTPGPVVLTVSVIGYAAAGVGGAALAALIAFLPSFLMVLGGAGRFDRLRSRAGPRAFLDGAGPAAVGAIFGAAALLAPQAFHVWWQPLLVVLAIVGALARQGSFRLIAGGLVVGTLAAVAGLPVPL